MAISDQFDDYETTLTAPICGGFDVTPDDATDLVSVTRAIMVGGDGDIAAVLKDGSTLTLTGLATGVVYPFRISRILASGTTATGIKGLI